VELGTSLVRCRNARASLGNPCSRFGSGDFGGEYPNREACRRAPKHALCQRHGPARDGLYSESSRLSSASAVETGLCIRAPSVYRHHTGRRCLLPLRTLGDEPKGCDTQRTIFSQGPMDFRPRSFLSYPQASPPWDAMHCRIYRQPAAAIRSARRRATRFNAAPAYRYAVRPGAARKSAKSLNLAPEQHSEEAIRAILGGVMTVVNGLGTLRNKLSDSHGRGGAPVKPSPRHARLSLERRPRASSSSTLGSLVAATIHQFGAIGSNLKLQPIGLQHTSTIERDIGCLFWDGHRLPAGRVAESANVPFCYDIKPCSLVESTSVSDTLLSDG
jgi:hypothetical protein